MMNTKQNIIAVANKVLCIFHQRVIINCNVWLFGWAMVQSFLSWKENITTECERKEHLLVHSRGRKSIRKWWTSTYIIPQKSQKGTEKRKNSSVVKVEYHNYEREGKIISKSWKSVYLSKEVQLLLDLLSPT